MSAPEEQDPVMIEQIPAQVECVVKNVLTRLKGVNINMRPIIEDMITFMSIIGAYQYISISYEEESQLQKWTGVEFSNKRTETVLLLIFAIYLITLKLIYRLAYSYQTAPVKKVIPQNWEEIQQQKPEQQSTPLNQPIFKSSQQNPFPSDCYSLLIKQLINNSIYCLVFVFCTTAYTYISHFNKKNKLVNLEQLNYLIFWFVTANIFYSIGKLAGKFTGIKTFHHFGFMVGLIAVNMEIGLAHGFNTFLFI